MNYFDPKVLAGVKNLNLRARVVVDGVMVGAVSYTHLTLPTTPYV